MRRRNQDYIYVFFSFLRNWFYASLEKNIQTYFLLKIIYRIFRLWLRTFEDYVEGVAVTIERSYFLCV